jgi:UPF0271 protein
MKNSAEPAVNRVIVLDTSAMVAGLDPFCINEDLYTVPAVKNEIGKNSMLAFRFLTAEENDKVRVVTPDPNFLKSAKKAASEVGDAYFLSEADLQVLALSLQLKAQGHLPFIATDDYSIQNVAKQLGIEFKSLITFGIRRRLEWLRYCPACHKIYEATYKSSKCDICGTEIKRKSVRRSDSNSK